MYLASVKLGAAQRAKEIATCGAAAKERFGSCLVPVGAFVVAHRHIVLPQQPAACAMRDLPKTIPTEPIGGVPASGSCDQVLAAEQVLASGTGITPPADGSFSTATAVCVQSSPLALFPATWESAKMRKIILFPHEIYRPYAIRLPPISEKLRIGKSREPVGAASFRLPGSAEAT